MTVVCGWCGITITPDDGQFGRDSHGICPECLAQQLSTISVGRNETDLPDRDCGPGTETPAPVGVVKPTGVGLHSPDNQIKP